MVYLIIETSVLQIVFFLAQTPLTEDALARGCPLQVRAAVVGCTVIAALIIKRATPVSLIVRRTAEDTGH